MRKAFQIFKRDLRRLLKNPVAVIVTIGVAIIPSLYAWFNILANWDPYENTSTVPIAVTIEDKGADIKDLGYTNAGDMIRERLEENDQLGWTFVDDENEAVEGVKAGKYYAAFVVPSDFTQDLADVLDGNTDKAHIAYYVNEKANAVAPKVTDTGSTTIDDQISNQFVEANRSHGVVVEDVVASIADDEPDAIFRLVGVVGWAGDVITRLWPGIAELRRTEHHLHRPKRAMVERYGDFVSFSGAIFAG